MLCPLLYQESSIRKEDCDCICWNLVGVRIENIAKLCESCDANIALGYQYQHSLTCLNTNIIVEDACAVAISSF